ncbi:Maintenance of morphology protein 1 [Parageobacillus thermantarcticus]|uniref:Maintenance of morphology protein 1 n=2 Tax=Parageobacillus thermantarcticus TaxID=186116 RepID=A0A1I0SG55_9BACL|nr:Maintenance of morphology protein 1 [Parageobacillus thermantarcticus]
MATEMGPRFAQRAKRRKINRILNAAIAVVVLLIIVVAWNLFSDSDRSNEQTAKPQPKTEVKKDRSEAKVEVEINQKRAEDEKSEQTDQEEASEEEQEVIETPGPPGSNIEKEIVNPAWQPIGTTQSEPHVTQFKKDSVDWKEMLDAVSYATGLSQSDMIVWFIGNNGPNKAVATISTKDKAQYYKVYIEWVENQGWKPTKVQQLRK